MHVKLWHLGATGPKDLQGNAGTNGTDGVVKLLGKLRKMVQ